MSRFLLESCLAQELEGQQNAGQVMVGNSVLEFDAGLFHVPACEGGLGQREVVELENTLDGAQVCSRKTTPPWTSWRWSPLPLGCRMWQLLPRGGAQGSKRRSRQTSISS